jgi:hypothetical protein
VTDPNEPDPFTSPSRRAERDRFEARGRMIRWGILGVVVLIVVAAILLIR